MEAGRPRIGHGHTVLEPGEPILASGEQLNALYQLSDPALSELGLEDLLEELLDRIRQALDVDTVAILLLDPSEGELVARAARGLEEEVEQGVRIRSGAGSRVGSRPSASQSLSATPTARTSLTRSCARRGFARCSGCR